MTSMEATRITRLNRNRATPITFPVSDLADFDYTMRGAHRRQLLSSSK